MKFWGQQRKDRSGFTLVELIVVLVILAILAAILVPSLTGWIDRSNAKVCAINRQLIARDIYANQLLAKGEGELYDAVADTQELTAQHRCPSGGQYTIAPVQDGYKILCSKAAHNSEVTTVEKLLSVFEAIKESYAGWPSATSVDSSAPNGPITTNVKKALADNGYSVDTVWKTVRDKKTGTITLYVAKNILENPTDQNYTDDDHIRVKWYCDVTKVIIDEATGAYTSTDGYAMGMWHSNTEGTYRILNDSSFTTDKPTANYQGK